MGKGGGSAPAPQPTSQTVNQTNLPEYAQPYFENIMNRAQTESYRPYQAYGGQRIAGFDPAQQAVQTETLGMPSTTGQFSAAQNLAGTAGAGALAAGAAGLGAGAGAMGAGANYAAMATSPAAQAAYMSPYMQNVVDVQKQEAIRDASKQQMQANLGAARQGTYGGARNILAQSEANRNLGAQLANIQAAGSQKAFEAATQAQQYGADLGLRGIQTGLQGIQTGLQGMGQATASAQGLGALTSQGQQTQLQRLAAQEAVGAQQQSQTQKALDQAYADFLRQRDYPMEQLGYYSNLLRGLPVQLGSTQTTYAQPPSMTQQIGGLGLAGLGLYNMMG